MARAARYAFFGLVTVVLQTTLAPGVSILGQRPDLVVIFAVLVGAFEGASRGCAAGFIVGFLVDIYHPATLGAGTIAGTVAGYAGARAQELLDLDMPLNQAAAFAFVTVLHGSIHALVVVLKGEGAFWRLVLGRVPGGALYTALVGVAVLGLVGFLRGGRHIVDRR
ncbi:rod shape-determining protein MreD [Gemmatimonadota bacterium]